MSFAHEWSKFWFTKTKEMQTECHIFFLAKIDLITEYILNYKFVAHTPYQNVPLR